MQESQKPGVLPDIIVYPVCFNFRHAIELYIKYLIADLGKAKRINATYRTDHSLRDNWTAAKKLIKRTKFRATPEQIAVIDTAVKNIMEVDPNGIIFRYPESIKGDRHLKDWVHINLLVIEQQRKEIFDVAKSWHYKLESLLDR